MDVSATIKGVSCYGKVEDNSNFHVVGDDSHGYEIDDVWLGDGESNWTQVINKILASYHDCEIFEVSAV